ncbi:MAG TPA: peptidylprolyl isomerase, partial [Pseudomonadales bacterium]|nr:peptidylprolyl isomerase [Pseudomonadales bacterium]
LLTVEANKLGMYYGDKSLDEEIVNTPVFQVDGKFSSDRFQQVLGGAGYTPLSYRQEMRTDKKLQQLIDGIRGSAFVTDKEVKRSDGLAEQTRDIAYLRIPVDKLTSQVSVSDDEIKDYYSNHPADFMSPETVKLSYIELTRDELMKDVKVTDDDLKTYYEQTKSDYSEQESRRVAHILIETNDKVTDADAKAKAEEIYKKIENGASFEEMAKKYSQDPGSAKNGGDLGFNPKGSFVAPFEKVEYSLKPNEISKPFKTQFGYHIVKLLAIKPAHVPDFAEVRDQVEKKYREKKAADLFLTKNSKLSEMAFESPDLKTPSQELGLPIKTTAYLARDAKTGIAADAGVMKAAFSPDVLTDGNNSSVIEVSQFDHIVLRVDDHKAQAPKPLEEVSANIKAKLIHEKASALAEKDAKDIVDELEKGAITRFVADKYGLKWVVQAQAGRNEKGLDGEITDEAFKLPRPVKGDKSIGYTLLAGGDAAVVSVTNVANETADKIDASSIATMQRILSSQRGTYEYQEFRDQLAANGDITRTK